MSDFVYKARSDPEQFESVSSEAMGFEVIDGDPNVRVHELRDTGDVWAGMALLDPATFTYTFHSNETVYFLEGELAMTVDGKTKEFGAGDIASFASGAQAHVVIKSALREFFVMSAASESADVSPPPTKEGGERT